MLTPTGYPHPNTAADMAHSTHSTASTAATPRYPLTRNTSFRLVRPLRPRGRGPAARPEDRAAGLPLLLPLPLPLFLDSQPKPLPSGSYAYVLNRYSRIPVAQPQENEYRIPPGEPCI